MTACTLPTIVVGRRAELAHLAALRLAVELLELLPHRVVAARLLDLRRDAELAQRLGQRRVNLGAFGKRGQDELPRVSARVGDLRLEAARLERLHGLLEAGTVGGPLELEVRRAGVGQREAHRDLLVRRCDRES